MHGRPRGTPQTQGQRVRAGFGAADQEGPWRGGGEDLGGDAAGEAGMVPRGASQQKGRLVLRGGGGGEDLGKRNRIENLALEFLIRCFFFSHLLVERV